jgi:hypothetical protein
MSKGVSGFLRRLVTPREGRADAVGGAKITTTEYEGYTIRAAPYQESGRWITAGIITKTFPDGVKEHDFVRADMFPGKDDAEAFSIAKGKRIIDELGDRLFEID